MRELRRRTLAVSGEQRLRDGTVVELSAARLAAPLDTALRAIAFGLVLRRGRRADRSRLAQLGGFLEQMRNIEAASPPPKVPRVRLEAASL